MDRSTSSTTSKSRESDIVAFNGFNEPYWTGQGYGTTSSCGVYSAAQLRQLRTQDPRQSGPEPRSTTTSAGRVSGPRRRLLQRVFVHRQQVRRPDGRGGLRRRLRLPVQDVGLHEGAGTRSSGEPETGFVVNSMHAVPVWLDQAHGGVDGLVFPTQAQILDWNCAVRNALPAGSLISWYVWRQGISDNDTLANPPRGLGADDGGRLFVGSLDDRGRLS